MVASEIVWTREAVCAACGSGQRLITATTSGMIISHCYRCGDSTTSPSSSTELAAVTEDPGETPLDLLGQPLLGASRT